MGRPITLILFLALSTQQLFGQAVPYGYNDETGRYFDAGNETSLYYEVYGEGPPLLLLHGGVFGYIDEFEYLIPKLAERYQVVALATRGHVKSDVATRSRSSGSVTAASPATSWPPYTLT
jgi:pimeloyl-ACP methyl ester carboxylesterase